MEIKTHSSMNCFYSLRDDNRICYSEVLYSEDKAIAVYQDDINEVSVFATAGSATKRYVEWFTKEMQGIHGGSPAINFYDMKRRDQLFQIKDEDKDLVRNQYATFEIDIKRLAKAVELGYFEEASCQNTSLSALEILKFTLKNKDKGNFTFGGYLIYPPRNDFRATIDSIVVESRHSQMPKLFEEFTKTKVLYDSDHFTYSAWWD